jgi:hypothetical protein
MNSRLSVLPRTFPSRIADLGFTANLPSDWVAHELPEEKPDFSDPTTFVPLAVVTAPHAAIVFAFVARPAYDDGTLHDWSWYLLNHNKLTPRAIGPDNVAGVPALVGEATQESELGPMVLRFAFFEDGGRLVNITFSAPEVLADAVRDAWFEMLKSFTLETPRGSRFGAAAPAPAESAPESQSHDQPVTEVVSPQADQETCAPAASAPPAAPKTFADYALANDTTSLDPESSINANLRENGVGLVPNIAATNDTQKRATLGAGAIIAQFDVPYGWHVIDDGKRTLVFEPGGSVQINLNLIPREGRSNAGLLDDIEAQTRSDYPHPEFVRIKEGKIHALGVRNIADGDQPLEQYHLLYPFRDDSMVLRARVTATPEQATNANNLAELILESCVFDCYQQRDEPKAAAEDNDGKPAWWRQALALEAQDKFEEAENVIREGCPYIGFAFSTAEMYRLRMLRLMSADDEAGARDAFKRSSSWIFFYASMATSGGEGAALSAERDQFRAQLVAAYGSDPEAVRA